MICVNPFSAKSDQYQFSPYNINTFSGVKVQRIYKIIAKEEMLSSFIIFSSANGSLKNDMVFSHFGQFPSRYHFRNLSIIISLLTQLLVKLALQIYKNGRHELLNEVEETANVAYKDILEWI